MTITEAVNYHMQRIDSGDRDFDRRVVATQRMLLRGTPAKERAAMIEEHFRKAVEIETEKDEVKRSA